MDKKKKDVPPEKEWTLMFYFASDNPLAPGVVSQLKALKNAGYHPDANVLAYFDPQTPGTPAHIFDVNVIEKLNHPGQHKIGFDPSNPFVRNLMLDKLWDKDQKARGGTPIRNLIAGLEVKSGAKFAQPKPPSLEGSDFADNGDHTKASNESKRGKGGREEGGRDPNRLTPPGPAKSFETFLNFCAQYYPAKRYMLFILGHGLVVGDDVFLYDQHSATHSVTLRELGNVLRKFKENDNVRKAEFELVSFHSCSMSSLEIASELKGTAKFMLASQGTAFVGSWPYLSILIRIFDDLEQAKLGTPFAVKEMIRKIFFYILHNSTDFILAGYSFDLCLCELSDGRIKAVEKEIQELSDELRKGLAKNAPALVKDCILLAHWKSQSYWQENYTDMYDFCLCLDHYCTELGATIGNMGAIQKAAGRVMDRLRPEDDDHPEQLVTIAQFVGPASQYSHGLSLFFPWSEPSQERPIMKEYKAYKFQKKTGWLDFLKDYFVSTMRGSRRTETDTRAPMRRQSQEEQLREDMAAIMFGAGDARRGAGALDDPIKTNPRDPMGDECTCGSIKNFPHDTRPRVERAKQAFREKPSPTLLSS
jgi:hypothetical protein